MGKVRRCDARCHNARNPECHCWCGGAFHGAAGQVNREAMARDDNPKNVLKEHGYQKGKTRYIDQLKLPLEGNNG